MHNQAENVRRDHRGAPRYIFEADRWRPRNHFCRWTPSPAEAAARANLPWAEKEIAPRASLEICAATVHAMKLASRPIRREELQRGRNSPRNVTRDPSLTLAARRLLHCAMIFIRVFIVVACAREKFPRVRTRIAGGLFRSSRCDNAAALL